MEGGGKEHVLEEVESLFKKLESLTHEVRQAAFRRIHEKLPCQTLKIGSEYRGTIQESSSRKIKQGRKQKTAVEKSHDVFHFYGSGDNESDYAVENILTSRGRKTKRLSYGEVNRPHTSNKLDIPTSSICGSNINKYITKDAVCTSTTDSDDMRCDGSASDGGFNVEAADNEAIPGSVIPSVFGESDLIIDTDITSTKNEAEKMPVRDFVSCDQCNFHTTSKSLLKSHLRKHSGTKPYGCKDCGKTFPQSSSLKVHMKRHRGQRDFPCDYDCDYRAYTKVDKIRHMTVHTGERNHVCQYCGKSFAKDCTLREHVKCVHERPTKHVCPKCGFSTFRANNLRVHINMRHRGEYDNHVCPVCGAKIKQKTAFLDHMRSHTGERPYSCHQCDSTFACIARLTVHRKAVHEPRQFTCKVCYKPFQTKHHLLRHSVIHTKEKPFGCPFCLYTCNTQGNVTKHVKTVHNKPDFSYRRYKEQQLVDADAKSVKSEWIEKGQKLTEEYLQQLSSKLGRSVTLSELQEREAEKMKQMSFELLQAKLKRINRIKRHEHSYHSNRMASDNDARLEEEAVDDPTALLLNVAQQISHDTGKDTEKPNSGIPLETENFASLNDESLAGISQTIFVQNSTEFQGDVVSDEYQAVLTTSEDNITSHVDPFVSSQTVELCVSEDTIDGDQPSLRLILPESEVESKERSRGKFAAMENEEYIQNFVTMKRNSQVNPTVVVIIKTENTPD